MRLFLLPISTRRTLIYAQRLQSIDPANASLLDRITKKANGVWDKWEHSESGWQKKVVGWGNNAFARIPAEEWALKSIPAWRRTEGEQRKEVELHFPQGLVEPAQALERVRTLATERVGFHRKWLIWSFVGMPFTAPFILIPIIPNIPFFYLAFRAWSHWKAITGSRTLSRLLSEQLIRPKSSQILQRIYNCPELSEERVRQLRKSIAKKLDEKDRTAFKRRNVELERRSTLNISCENAHGWEVVVAKAQTGQLISLYYDFPQIEAEMARAIAQTKRLIRKEEGKESEKRQETGHDTQREKDTKHR